MMLLTKNQNGFTLVELLIALVIFAVGILGVGAMQLTSIQGNSKGRQVSEASNIGADRIERFLSLDYDNPLLDDDDGDGNSGLDDLSTPDGNFTSADGNYQLFWNVAVDLPLPNTKTIKFIIDPPGSGKNVEMTYIMVDNI